VERWVYRYDGPGNGWDWANSIVMGLDGNLYAAGCSKGDGTDLDFTVVSLASSGTERWVYRYNGSGNGPDEANSIAMGFDGLLYAAGYSYESGTVKGFMVLSLDSMGGERWVYQYDGPGDHDDWANSIVPASDGNLYIAGTSHESGSYADFTVVSLGSDVGVVEGLNRPSAPDVRLLQFSPNPFHKSTIISYSLSKTTSVTLAIYDITGRLVETLVNETQQPGVHQVNWDRKVNPSGVYFYRLSAAGFVETKKMVVVE
jgi:hypothetical protein